MDKQKLKEELHQYIDNYIDNMEDETTLDLFREATVELTRPEKIDIVDQLTPNQLEQLDEAIKLADEGKTISHSEAMKRITAWRSK
jgi:hypothetical protein